MTMETKNEIFDRYKKEYFGASKERKSAILAAVCEVTGMHRKAAIRKFRALQVKNSATPERRGRRVYYDKAVDAAFRDVWEAAKELCGENLHPAIREYVAIFRRDGMWAHGDVATAKLLAMSERTVKRRVAAFLRERGVRKGKGTTSPSALKPLIPIFKGPWGALGPGGGQLDTVAHCGETTAGAFAYTVNYTDAATYWTVMRAQWNKGEIATRESIEEVERRLPFPLRGLHPDSGSEFLNWHLKRWCDEHDPPITLSRSEPNRKNDNMYVEERNGHIVRKYAKYDRLDDHGVVPLLNELYDVLERYLNHFIPVRRMVSKERVGAKYVRRYEKRAMTPYERVMARDDIPESAKERSQKEHAALNPLLLKRRIDTLQSKIYQHMKAARNRNAAMTVR